MKKENINYLITNTNWQDFKITVTIEPILDININDLTVMKKHTLFGKFFKLKNIKLIDTVTNRYNIIIDIENGKKIKIKLDDLDPHKYLIPFISYYKIKELEFLGIQHLPNLNIEHVIKSIKKSLEPLSESNDFIKYVVSCVRKTIKDEKYYLTKKDFIKIDILNITIVEFKNKILDDMKNNTLPKSLVEYLDIYGKDGCIFNK